MKTRILAFVFAVAALFAFTPAFNVVKASPAKTLNKAAAVTTLPVTGTHDFRGHFTIQKFVSRQGQLKAIGTLIGTYTDNMGNKRSVTQQVAMPVSSITGTCKILHLVLGPLDLNLLGLMVHLNTVVLDITAQQGGGLLGDLLCAVANLLHNGGSLSQITSLLNQILSIIG